jgi:hypothetical protein
MTVFASFGLFSLARLIPLPCHVPFILLEAVYWKGIAISSADECVAVAHLALTILLDWRPRWITLDGMAGGLIRDRTQASQFSPL